MLCEITIRNFAIVDELRVEFADGFNILTGETGAGKSIIIDAVELLLGGRASKEIIRAGSDRASVEGIFLLDDASREAIDPILDEYDLSGDDDQTLILSREISQRRSICRVNNRAVTLSVLSQIGQNLIDIHGQTEHLSLLKSRKQLDFLDRYAGLEKERAEISILVDELRLVRSELRRLRQDSREIAYRVDWLRHQIDEIESASLRIGEDEELESERRRLANAEKLLESANEICESLYGSTDKPSAYDLVSSAIRMIGKLADFDRSVLEHGEMLEEALIQIEEVARQMRLYMDGIEFNPGRLAEIEDRIRVVNSLKRKYGATIEEVLASAESARKELSEISNSDERVEELSRREEKLLLNIGRLASNLSRRRSKYAAQLSREVEKQLADLNMSRARFRVALTQEHDADGVWVGDERFAFDSTGIDKVEFQVSANSGEPLRPLARVASGGETSRLMLAMKAVLSSADDIPTLIFDEIDTGIGGRIGSIVGEKMWRLAMHHQVLCVTHLPQLAAYADKHYRVEKIETHGRTVTTIKPLSREGRIEEIALMMGADTPLAAESARKLMRQVEEIKSNKSQETNGGQ